MTEAAAVEVLLRDRFGPWQDGGGSPSHPAADNNAAALATAVDSRCRCSVRTADLGSCSRHHKWRCGDRTDAHSSRTVAGCLRLAHDDALAIRRAIPLGGLSGYSDESTRPQHALILATRRCCRWHD